MPLQTLEPRVDPWSAAAVEQNRRWLTAYLLALTGDADAAADMVQEVFAVALAKRGEFQAGTNFGGWLRVIARNIALQHCARRGRELLVDREDVLAHLDRAAAAAAEREAAPGHAERRAAALRECLAGLSERVRRLVEQRYAEGRPAAEVAAGAGLSVPALHMALCRARFALAECIRRRGS